MIKTIPFPGPIEHDLTGRTFSDLLVIGYAGPKYNCDGSKWVVRCLCGNYETRRSQRLKKQREDRIYRCQECEDLINKINHEKYLKTLTEA